MSGISLNPGIYYEFLTNSSASGASVPGIVSVSGSSKTTEHYVNIPLHLSFALNFAPTFKFFVYGGPTASVGIASTTKSTSSASIDIIGWSSGPSTSTSDNYAEGSNYSRFDIMAGGGEYQHHILGFNANLERAVLYGGGAGLGVSAGIYEHSG